MHVWRYYFNANNTHIVIYIRAVVRSTFHDDDSHHTAVNSGSLDNCTAECAGHSIDRWKQSFNHSAENIPHTSTIQLYRLWPSSANYPPPPPFPAAPPSPRRSNTTRAGGMRFFFSFFFSHYFHSSSFSFWTSRSHRCRPFFPPVLAFNFYRA